MKLVALTMQASHGPMSENKLEPLGIFDVIGKNRREQWSSLGTMTKLHAMEGFIDLLDRLCPSFRPYVEALKQDRNEKMQQAAIDQAQKMKELEDQKKSFEAESKIQEEKYREEMQRRKLQEALNQQTFYQFKEYAERQFPGNPEQQATLIKQLQTEHYTQYLQQLQSQLQHGESDQTQDVTLNAKEQEMSLVEEKDQCDSDEESGDFAVVSPASMWTRCDIKEFKNEVTAAGGDGVIRVGHGDCVTVRVPTLEGKFSTAPEGLKNNLNLFVQVVRACFGSSRQTAMTSVSEFISSGANQTPQKCRFTSASPMMSLTVTKPRTTKTRRKLLALTISSPAVSRSSKSDKRLSSIDPLCPSSFLFIGESVRMRSTLARTITLAKVLIC